MSLPALGRFSYGGVNLNSDSVQTTGISSRPKMDAANRGRTCTEYTISLRFKVTGNPTDDSIRELRRALSQPGQNLVYEDRGYSDLTIDGGTDVMWGPHPKEMGFRPLGGGNACEIDWQVTVSIACEGGAQLAAGGGVGEIIEWVFSISYDNDYAGYTTRTINVTIRVPGSRATGKNSRRLALSPDEYREKLAPPLVPGFRRTYPTWDIDESKTVLRGTIVDEEMGVIFPPKWAADIQADEEIYSAEAGLASWGGTINANYELVKGAPVTTIETLRHFLGNIVKDRIAALAAGINNAKSIVPMSLRMRNPEIYGRRKASFSFTYRFTQELRDIMSAITLWRPVPGSNWKEWAASMTLGPAHPRGFTQMKFRPGDDSIVDGCGGSTPGMFNTIGQFRTPLTTGSHAPVSSGVSQALRTFFPPPTPRDSWIHYECWVWVEVDASTIPVQTLPELKAKRLIQAPGQNPFAPNNKPIFPGVFDPFANPFLPGGVFNPNQKKNNIDNVQQRKPEMYVYLRGRALRYGFDIPIPILTDFAGSTPVLATRLDRGEGYGRGIIRAAGDRPVIGATWNLRYAIPDPPDGFVAPLPPNPLLKP